MVIQNIDIARTLEGNPDESSQRVEKSKFTFKDYSENYILNHSNKYHPDKIDTFDNTLMSKNNFINE